MSAINRNVTILSGFRFKVTVWPFGISSAWQTAANGKRHIRGGRAALWSVLFMATLRATRCNPVIQRFYQHLRLAGKETKVALVACMRKLLTILNAMRRTKQS